MVWRECFDFGWSGCESEWTSVDRPVTVSASRRRRMSSGGNGFGMRKMLASVGKSSVAANGVGVVLSVLTAGCMEVALSGMTKWWGDWCVDGWGMGRGREYAATSIAVMSERAMGQVVAAMARGEAVIVGGSGSSPFAQGA